MARTKSENSEDQFTIQERVSIAALSFTQQILQILGSSTLAELSALRERVVAGDVRGAAGPGPAGRIAAPAEAVAGPDEDQAELGGDEGEGQGEDEEEVLDKGVEDRILKDAMAAEMPRETGVECPVPGCKSPGIRPKRNFCLKHSRMMTKEAQIRMLDDQQKRLRDQARAAEPRPRTNKKRAG